MTEAPITLPDEQLLQLVELIDRLRDETAEFLDHPGDQQLWYNRGYANGMVLALHPVGQAECLGSRHPDAPERLGGHLALPWDRAYRHGESRGCEEAHEITGIPAT